MPTRKAGAVLAWVAAQPRPPSREAAAALLWGDGRLRNVRQELYRLRKLPGAAAWLVEEGGTLALRDAQVDAHTPGEAWDGGVLEDLSELTPRFEQFREDLRRTTLARWLPEQMARAEAALAASQHGEAARLLDHALTLAPEDADLLALREAAAATAGDRAGALRARAAGQRTLSLHADRLRRLLAVAAAGHPGWPGPSPAPPLPPAAVAAAIGGDALLLADALAELQKADIIDASGQLRERPDAQGADAPLVHRQLAQHPDVPPAVSAWHLSQAGETEAAARRYLDASEPWTAARAEALAPPGPLRARAIAVQIDHARRDGARPEEEALLLRLQSLARDTQSLLVFSERDRQRAIQALYQGNAQEAIRLAGRAAAHAADADAPAAQARARLVRAAAHLRCAETDAARVELEAASGSGDEQVELTVLNALGAAHALGGDLDAAHRVHAQALRIARRRGDTRACVRLLNNLAATAERRAAYADSDEAFAEVLALGEHLGEQNITRIAALNRAQIALVRGRLGEARALLRQHPDKQRQPREIAWANRLRGAIEQLCGRPEEARDRLRRAHDTFEALGDAIQVANIRFSLALLDGAPLGPPLEALAAVASPFLLATARMEALLDCDDPALLRTLIEQVSGARQDPHARLLVHAGRARLALESGQPAHMPTPTLEIQERPRLLALCARLADTPTAQARLREETLAAAQQQATGLLTAQRDALLARVGAWLPAQSSSHSS